MKWMKWYIILLVLLLVLYMVADYNRPRTVDWTPTYSNHDKIPYGTWIVFNELKNYFPGQQPVEQTLPLYDHTNNSLADNELYLVVNNNLATTQTDEEELYKYIERGNTVFIAVENLGKTFTEKFKVDITWHGSLLDNYTDSSTINFTSPSLKAKKNYSLEKGTLETYFSKVDTGRTTILGTDSHGGADFIRIKIGEGYLFMHAAPRVFTNYFALKDDNIGYLNKVFSYLPEKPSAIYWDEYYKAGGAEAETPLRVLLTRPNLRWAYFIALATILLYVLFQAKRRQRIIPVMEPPKNDSREFVETISRVYYNQKHHLNIANKKISHWLDFVRTRFGVSTKELNDDFITHLSHRTGIRREEIAEITGQANLCRVRPAISAEELLRINQLIDNFYKQAR